VDAFNPVVLLTNVWGLSLEFRLFGALAFLVLMPTFPYYIKTMIRDPKHAPPKSTWFLCFALDSILFASRLNSGILDAMLLAYVVGSFFIFVFTIKYGKKGWTIIETLCCVFVGVSIIVWIVADPFWATIASLVGVTVAFYPLASGVFKGEYENILVWIACIVSCFFNLLDGQVLVSLWMMGMQVAIVAPVLYYHKYLPKKKEKGGLKL